ncbi:MAG: hypothetical protein WB952_13905 [Terriglobales bacterium]
MAWETGSIFDTDLKVGIEQGGKVVFIVAAKQIIQESRGISILQRLETELDIASFFQFACGGVKLVDHIHALR